MIIKKNFFFESSVYWDITESFSLKSDLWDFCRLWVFWGCSHVLVHQRDSLASGQLHGLTKVLSLSHYFLHRSKCRSHFCRTAFYREWGLCHAGSEVLISGILSSSTFQEKLRKMDQPSLTLTFVPVQWTQGQGGGPLPTPTHPSPGCRVLPFSQLLRQSAWWSQGSPPGPFLPGSSRRPRRGEIAGCLPMFWGWFWIHSAALWALTAVSHKGESGIGAQSILFSGRSE